MKFECCFVQVHTGLTKNISSTKYHLGKNSKESVLDILPNTTKEQLLDVSLHPLFMSSLKNEHKKRRQREKQKRLKYCELYRNMIVDNCGIFLPISSSSSSKFSSNLSILFLVVLNL